MSLGISVSPDWIAEYRFKGATRFREAGLPTQRVEAWKYTGLNKLRELSFAPCRPEEQHTFPVPPALLDAPAHRLTFVNGRYDKGLSAIGAVPDGATLGALSHLLRTQPEAIQPLLGRIADIDRRAMVALNAGWFDDGLVVIAPRGLALGPIEVTFIADGETSVCHPRHIISLGENAAATIVEHHAGHGFANAVSEITLAAGARLGHYVVHVEPPQSLAVENAAIRVGRDASYQGFGLTAGGGLVRRDIEVMLEHPGASARLDGAYLVDGDRHADTTIFVDHKAPHCQSRQTQKGVIGGKGRAVFQGKILVRPDAQKTDGAQLSQTLLLSPEAEIDVKPELEIHADDVKCSHGATVGRLDADALFFLRARGIPEPQARALLIEGFIGGALDEIAHADVREAFAGVAAAWLHGHSSPETHT